MPSGTGQIFSKSRQTATPNRASNMFHLLHALCGINLSLTNQILQSLFLLTCICTTHSKRLVFSCSLIHHNCSGTAFLLTPQGRHLHVNASCCKVGFKLATYGIQFYVFANQLDLPQRKKQTVHFPTLCKWLSNSSQQPNLNIMAWTHPSPLWYDWQFGIYHSWKTYYIQSQTATQHGTRAKRKYFDSQRFSLWSRILVNLLWPR